MNESTLERLKRKVNKKRLKDKLKLLGWNKLKEREKNKFN
jgi:hypothetical protein